MASRRLSLISFDAVNTLMKPAGGGVGAQYAAAAQRLAGWRYDPNLLQAAFFEELRSQRRTFPNYGFERGMSDRQWWMQVVVNTFETASSRKGESRHDNADGALLEYVAAHLFETFEWELFPHTHQLLRHLKETLGLQLCVVSNSDERLGAILQVHEISHFFDLVLTSRGVGVEKPDARIFQRVFEHFGPNFRPEETLHVGDDSELDFEAAKRFGMRALLVDHHRRRIERDDDFVCRDLVELRQKIDRLVSDRD